MLVPAPFDPKGLIRAAALAAICALAAGVLGCGGGGGSPATSATQLAPTPSAAPAAAASVTVTGFSPTSAAPGATITLTGAGFAGVTAARIGSVSASFRIVSDTTLEVTVPAGASTGRIELSAAGTVVLSASDLTVVAVPVIASVTPTTVIPPARITIAGTALDAVREVKLGGITLAIATRTPTSLGVDVPATATSGTLTLVDNDGISRPSAQRITVTGPLRISSFSPQSIVTGQSLTVNGSSLDRVTSITYANGVNGGIASRDGTTRLSIIVPDAAGSGVFRLLGNLDDEVLSATPLQVIPAIRVNANTVYRVNAVGDAVSMTGTGLSEVSAVRVGSMSATIVSKTATELVFSAPALACGGITLDSSSQPSVAGGSLVVGAGCVASVAGVEFAQVLSQGVTDVRQRVVPGKETWVRAYVVATQSNVPAPLVRLTGYNGATILGTVDMAGPATLPVVIAATVPDAIRYDEAQSFNVELPAAWVRSGLSVRVEADPLRQFGAPVVVDATPVVGLATKIELVLVPLISGGYVPTMPTLAAVLDEVTRRFPIPRANISVTMRQAYTLTSVTDGLDLDTEWQNALNELRQLRAMEVASGNTTRFYFGFVKRSGGGIAGIGYVPGFAAIGWDANTLWPRTMSHELGHNLSRPHAPCGGAASPDPNYPYAGGLLGPTPLTDSIPAAIDIQSPSGLADIMGYCNGSWFSDYNYREMQRYMESQSGLVALQAAQAAAAAVEQDMLLVSGSIGSDGIRLAPVQALRGVPTAGTGNYTLRVSMRDGRTFAYPFDADLVDHAEPAERHFAVLVPDPGGAVASLDVLHGIELIAQRPGGRLRSQSASAPDLGRLRAVDWSESNGVLHVQWDTAAASHLAVTYVDKGQRTVLGVSRGGGSAEFDTAGLPAGGHFELALSDGLNARTLLLQR
ncbi:MAG TPA: IPT/TIG domain-containing protein [Burkholderiaceae bacterium]|nr:IPT/TIG domain-containing protein [Burkholderiaceae bacterium]